MLPFSAFFGTKFSPRKLMKLKTDSFSRFGNILNLFKDIFRTPANVYDLY